MRIVVSGASGLVGTALVAALEKQGHEVRRLVRRAAQRPGEHAWDPAAGTLDPGALTDADALIHLAGENIAKRRWTAAQKARIRDSRVASTTLLAGAIRQMDHPPGVVLGASAIGYFGAHRGDEQLLETSPPGDDFLARTCTAWEAAYEPIAEAGCRLALFRIGVVLSPRGGALAKMLPAFRRGLGGRLGPGTQYMSWISIDDLIAILTWALRTDSARGIFNATAPQPVTNREFTSALARVLRRPAVLPAPAPLLRLLAGEIADALLLSSNRVVPRRLLDAGFTFSWPELEPALRHLIG